MHRSTGSLGSGDQHPVGEGRDNCSLHEQGPSRRIQTTQGRSGLREGARKYVTGTSGLAIGLPVVGTHSPSPRLPKTVHLFGRDSISVRLARVVDHLPIPILFKCLRNHLPTREGPASSQRDRTLDLTQQWEEDCRQRAFRRSGGLVRARGAPPSRIDPSNPGPWFLNAKDWGGRPTSPAFQQHQRGGIRPSPSPVA